MTSQLTGRHRSHNSPETAILTGQHHYLTVQQLRFTSLRLLSSCHVGLLASDLLLMVVVLMLMLCIDSDRDRQQLQLQLQQ